VRFALAWRTEPLNTILRAGHQLIKPSEPILPISDRLPILSLNGPVANGEGSLEVFEFWGRVPRWYII
jgi:hypothetical protein